MMTNKEILQIAMQQSAWNLGAEPGDFEKSEHVFVDFNLSPNACKYLQLPINANLISYGNNIVAGTSPENCEIIKEYVGKFEWYHCFEAPNMHWLSERLLPLGQKICFMAEYFLPDVNKLKRLECGYKLRVLGKEDFASLYLPEWSNALCEKRKELDCLGVGAYDNGKLVDDSTFVGATLNAGNSNMGTFNLELVDFQRTFNSFSGISVDSLNEFKEKFKAISNEEREAEKAEKEAALETEKVNISLDENDKSAADDFEIMESDEKKADTFDEPGSDDFLDIEDIAPGEEKDETPYSIAIGFGRQSALLFEAKRRVFGFEHDSDEMKRVKDKLEKLGKVNGGSIDDVKKALDELKSAADAYTTSGKKAHNKRYDAVKALGELASKELENIKTVKEEMAASAESKKEVPAEDEKKDPAADDEAKRLTSILEQKGITVPEGFAEKLAAFKKDADEAEKRMGSQRQNGEHVSGDDLKRVASYKQIKESIENGSFNKEAFEKLVTNNNLTGGENQLLKTEEAVHDAPGDVKEIVPNNKA